MERGVSSRSSTKRVDSKNMLACVTRIQARISQVDEGQSGGSKSCVGGHDDCGCARAS